MEVELLEKTEIIKFPAFDIRKIDKVFSAKVLLTTSSILMIGSLAVIFAAKNWVIVWM